MDQSPTPPPTAKQPQDDPDSDLSATSTRNSSPSADPDFARGRSRQKSPATPTPNSAETSVAAKEKARVRFNSNASATKPPTLVATTTTGTTFPADDIAIPGPSHSPPEHHHRHLSSPTRPRPSILRGNSANSVLTTRQLDDFESKEGLSAAAAAQARANQVALNVKRDSPSPSSRASLDSSVAETVSSGGELLASDYNNIPLRNLDHATPGAVSEHEQQHHIPDHDHDLNDEAYKLVQAHAWRTQQARMPHEHSHLDESALADDEAQAGLAEVYNATYDGVYNVPPPQHYRGSVLSQLLKLYKQPEQQQQQQQQQQGQSHYTHQRSQSASSLGGQTLMAPDSGTATPRRKWYEQNRSQDTLANLIGASTKLANPMTDDKKEDKKDAKKKRPMHKRTGSNSRLAAFWQKEEARITVHIAGTLARQEFIIKLCRALMLYGAPTHRLEEYLSMTARVLEIDGQFLYLPGCMIISFDDRSTHTTEVKIVRLAQGIDLGKLKDVHRIYKEVMHDVMGVEEATEKLDALMKKKDKFHPWLRVLVFGLTSVTAAPFSFKARLIDLPLCFFFGCVVGILQLIVAPMSNLYSNVFEVTATVLISFLARAFGSLAGGDLFCFSALCQGGIVMLLPGYMVLSSSLELQSRAIVPGSIRIVYAVIYSLLLGFGITVGAAIYGLFDKKAVSDASCSNPLPSFYGFLFVPPFVICISILYQAKWRQMPVMVVIAFAGYIVNFFSSLRFSASPQIASTLGAFTVGVLANLYSRLRHGVAAATLIPAIFTQVPGGLASTGGLLSGLKTANMINNSSQPINGTSTIQWEEDAPLNNVVFDVAASMIQIAIGIAVGLFISALIIYPLGKRRSGLFSF